jgi:hypothetical protein
MPDSRPDWTRIIWASRVAREAWEPRVQAIQRAWVRVEVASVERLVRAAALVYGKPETNLSMREVAPTRWAVARSLDLDVFCHAYETGDDNTVGRLLGYPECCRAFFSRTWGGANVDTTWEMLAPGLRADGPVESNILGRWLGVRLVPHLPCSFNCTATVAFAERLAPSWPAQELAWAKEILNWPCEWNARHGIAEVRFPVLKLSTRTTVYPEKRTIQRHGPGWPAEAARGLQFPYQKPVSPLPLVRPVLQAAIRPEDNGFLTRSGMDSAHEMILAALHDAPPRGTVLDLGAGDGRLMRRIAATFAVPVQGVESVPLKASKDPLVICDDLRHMMTVEGRQHVDTIVVSVRRYEEVPGLEAWCRAHARQVLTYSYDYPMFTSMEAACLTSR